MIIAIRKEPNGTLYMDKDIYSRTQEVQDEQGNITIQPLFSDETLAQPPYNYTKAEIDDNLPYLWRQEKAVGDFRRAK